MTTAAALWTWRSSWRVWTTTESPSIKKRPSLFSRHLTVTGTGPSTLTSSSSLWGWAASLPRSPPRWRFCFLLTASVFGPRSAADVWSQEGCGDASLSEAGQDRRRGHHHRRPEGRLQRQVPPKVPERRVERGSSLQDVLGQLRQPLWQRRNGNRRSAFGPGRLSVVSEHDLMLVLLPEGDPGRLYELLLWRERVHR